MDKIRTFISIDVPITDEIRSILRDLKLTDGIRPSPESQIHITLKFLGDTDSRKIPKLCEKLKIAFEGKERFDLCMKGIGMFPNSRNPRVLWIGFDDGALLRDTADLVNSVVNSMNLTADDKPFSPHVTVGRFDGKADISGILSKYMGAEFCRFTCSRINVMKSELSPKGAKHSVMGTVELI